MSMRIDSLTSSEEDEKEGLFECKPIQGRQNDKTKGSSSPKQ